MAKWVVRGQYPAGHVVEEFEDPSEAQAAIDRHRQQGVRVAVGGPPLPGHPTPVVAEVPPRCSFCGKDRQAVAGLVNGPAAQIPERAHEPVAICNECVALCAEMLGVQRR